MLYAQNTMLSSIPSKLPPDPLSDIFSLLALASVSCTRLEAGGDWALRFPERERLKFVAVLRGAVWIMLPESRYLLKAGDTFMLTNTPFVVAGNPHLLPQDGTMLFEAADTNVLRLGGTETVMLGGAFFSRMTTLN